MIREQLKTEALEEIEYIKTSNGLTKKDSEAIADLIARQDAYIDELASGWQDISTAPKGVYCILTFDYKGVYEGKQDLEGHDGMWFRDSWEVATPIAWMPMPAPPKQG